MHELIFQQGLLRLNSCFACQQDVLPPQQAVWSRMGLMGTFYSGKIPKFTEVQKQVLKPG